VNRDADLVNSPERVATPLRRSGPKGSGQFTPITWDEALDEIAAKWKAVIAESGPLALLGYAYSAHQGLMNRGLVGGLFHALGSSRLQAGTVCDTCCEEAWNVTVGPIGGADPEDVVHSDLVISWGADLAATNVHYWSLVEHTKKQRSLPVIVIDPRRTRSAKAADLYLPIRIGTDAALALGVMHILVRDKKADRNYLSNHTVGFDRVERDILPKFPPARVAEITGLAVADIEKLASMYGNAKAAMIRLGEGMTRLANGGQALRTVALLPGVSGHYAVRGGGALPAHRGLVRPQLQRVRKPSGPATTRLVNHLRLGEALLNMSDPPIRALYISANNPAVTCPEAHKVRKGLARGPVHRGARSLHDRHREYADIVLPAASYLETDDLYRAYGAYWMQWGGQAAKPRGKRAPTSTWRRRWPAHGPRRPDLHPGAAGRGAGASSRARPVPQRRPSRRKLFAGEPIHIKHDWQGSRSRRPRASSSSSPSSWPKQGLSPVPDWNSDPIEAADAASGRCAC
jgi:anaerobic selenocysteine-containing dehydrogenase